MQFFLRCRHLSAVMDQNRTSSHKNFSLLKFKFENFPLKLDENDLVMVKTKLYMCAIMFVCVYD